MHRFRKILIMPALLLIAVCGCEPRSRQPRSPKSFDEICALVTGKSDLEVGRLLGRPDNRETNPLGEERWVWWDYTFLAGESYSPEVRDRAVHLEITLSPSFPAETGGPGLRVRDALSVGYLLPSSIQ